MLKTFSTFDDFWNRVSKSFKSRNHPTFHPCCGTWTTRLKDAFKPQHASSLKWKQLFNNPNAREASQREYLQAHMIEHGWGLPIRINYPCSSLKPQPNSCLAPKAAFDSGALCSIARSPPHPSPRSDPLPFTEAHVAPRWPSHEQSILQPVQLQPIQIEINSKNPAPAAPVLLENISAINLRYYQHYHHVREYSHEVHKMSNSIRSHFSASDKTVKDLTNQLAITKTELATVTERSAALEQNLQEVQKVLGHLVKQLNPAATELVAVSAVKKEVLSLEQKCAKLEAEKVNLSNLQGRG
jgi:hypothetical protein